jgi:hypothetical protein
LNSNDLDIKNINKNKDIRKGTIFTKYNW